MPASSAQILFETVDKMYISFNSGKWFEPRSISSSYCVIVRVRVGLKRTTLTRTITQYEIII